MIVKFGMWESEEFDPTVSQMIKRGFYVPYGNSQWVVLDEFVFWSHRIQAGIVIPKWFLTDLASIPRGFRWLISVNEKHRDAALPHDVMYSFWSHLEVEKSEADLIFRDFLIVSDIPKWKRMSMYQAVNLFGGSSWLKREPRFASVGEKEKCVVDFAHLPCLDLGLEDGEAVLVGGI